MHISCIFFLDSPENQAYDGIRNPYVLAIYNDNFYCGQSFRTREFRIHDRDNLRNFVREAGFRLLEYFDLDSAPMLHLLERTQKDEALGEWIC